MRPCPQCGRGMYINQIGHVMEFTCHACGHTYQKMRMAKGSR